MTLNDRQSQYLDAWRGGSAIIVLIGHSFAIIQPDASPYWNDLGTGAVMLFFVLSGFFIRRSLDKSLEAGRPGLFVAARVNRILPPFLFSLIVTAALCWSAPFLLPHPPPDFASAVAARQLSLNGLLPTMLFANGFLGPTIPANAPLWSLSFEVWYYALALMLALPRWRWVGVVAAGVLTWRNLDFALLGSVWVLGFFLPKMPRWLILLPIPATIIAVLYRGTSLNFLLWELTIGVSFAAHLANLPENPPRLWIERSANWSYTLYVIHFPLLLFGCALLGANWLLPVAIFGLAASIGPRIERIRLIRPAPRPHLA